MNQLLELKQRKTAFLDAAQATIDKALSEGRALTEDEDKSIVKAKEDAAAIQRTINHAEAMKDETANSDKGFHNVTRAEEDKPFANFGEFLRSVKSSTRGDIDPRLKSRAIGMNESIDSEGGFLVDKEISNELTNSAYSSSIATRCDTITLGSANAYELRMLDETSRQDGKRGGGIRTFWKAEAQQFEASQTKFKKITVEAHKLTGLCYVTNELLRDASGVASEVNSLFADEMRYVIDDVIIWGDGVGKPLGFMNSGALVAVAKETSPAQSNHTIVTANVLNMYARLWRKAPGAVWLHNDDIFPQLPLLQIGDQPVFIPPGGLSTSQYGTLLGRSMQPIEQAESLGQLGDLMLVDLSQYKLVRKNELIVSVSEHVRFLTDETAFKFSLRVGGHPKWQVPLTPAKGANTLSPFVVLAKRAA